MSLPKPKTKKLISEKSDKLAEKVKVILEEEAKYLREKKLIIADLLSAHTYSSS